MSNELIRVDRESLEVGIAESAGWMIDETLASADLVLKVDSDATRDTAVRIQGNISTLRKAIERARVSVKKPFLDACRRIDAAAEKASKDLEVQEVRIAKLAGDYAQEQLEIARRAEQARLAELRKIQEQAQREADEAAAKAREELAKACEAVKAAQREGQEAAVKAKAESLQKAADLELKAIAERAAQAAEALGGPVELQRAEGQTVRETWEYECVNEFQAFKQMPTFFKLVLQRQQVREWLDLLTKTGQEPKCIGMRFWREIKSGVRQATAQKAIDV